MYIKKKSLTIIMPLRLNNYSTAINKNHQANKKILTTLHKPLFFQTLKSNDQT